MPLEISSVVIAPKDFRNGPCIASRFRQCHFWGAPQCKLTNRNPRLLLSEAGRPVSRSLNRPELSRWHPRKNSDASGFSKICPGSSPLDAVFSFPSATHPTRKKVSQVQHFLRWHDGASEVFPVFLPEKSIAGGGRVRMRASEGMNYPAASCGVSKAYHANMPILVTPECFYRGSRSGFAWIPA
jgi:hypothetical protein